MKTISRLLLVVAIVAAAYFATIGRDDFYRFLDAANEVIQTIAENYRKK